MGFPFMDRPYQIAIHPYEFKTRLYLFIFPRNLPLALSSGCNELEQHFAPQTQEILRTCLFPIALWSILQGVKLRWAHLPCPMLTNIYICKLSSWPSTWRDSSTFPNHVSSCSNESISEQGPGWCEGRHDKVLHEKEREIENHLLVRLCTHDLNLRCIFANNS